MTKIRYIKGDLLKASEPLIGHGVNCRGIMGAGIAKQIKQKHPEVFKRYKNLCDEVNKDPCLLGASQIVADGNVHVCNMFTQVFPGPYAKLYAIQDCFEAFSFEALDLEEIAIPMIGCGLGGLDWKDVEDVILTSKTFLDEVRVYYL